MRENKEELVTVIDIVGGEADILNAEADSVKYSETGLFLCTGGEAVVRIDGATHHIGRDSLLVYFSYGSLRILSRSADLRGTLIGARLEALQPLLYSVTNFNALFVIKQAPHQTIPAARRENILQYIDLFKKAAPVQGTGYAAARSRLSGPVAEIARKQADLLGQALMLEVLQCYAGADTAAAQVSRKDEILQRFVASLYHSYRSRHEVSHYAKELCLTTRYFSTIVSERSGKTPSQWITTALLVDAKNLLKTTNMTVKEISDRLNFPNQSYFGKWFKNLTGISPLDFRKGRPKTEDDAAFADIVRRGINHAIEE